MEFNSQVEEDLMRRGIRVAGVDEVGRGCLAGPVVACALVLDYRKFYLLKPAHRLLVRDSKTMTRQEREKAEKPIQSVAHCWALGIVEHGEIDSLGLSKAVFLAMKIALQKISHGFDHVLVDGNQNIKGITFPQTAIIKGDALVYAISAASVLAKLHRDRLMYEQDHIYPGYGFGKHVGYSTKYHLKKIADLGPCPLHRKNFRPVRLALEKQMGYNTPI